MGQTNSLSKVRDLDVYRDEKWYCGPGPSAAVYPAGEIVVAFRRSFGGGHAHPAVEACVVEADKKLAGLEERLEAWKKREAEGLKAMEDVRKMDIEDIQAEIQAAVESGKITQEQADEKLAWLEANEDSSWKDVVADSR